jgi:predicted O-methyltransferase YrrM
MPHKTSYDEWKLTDPNIFKKELFLKSSNSEIFQENFRYLLSIKPREGFDLVYIDGDHSFEGTKFDHIYTLQVINPTATIIIDDIWDDRLKEVRRYFDQLPNEKWDFKEWNLEHPDMVQNMGVISPENIFKDN